MGVDTRYWGPSAWQLFHLIAFKSRNPQAILLEMKEMLPCKFCRASTKEYVYDHPLKGDAGKWLYEIHNMVNNKLRTQCAEDPAVVNPGPNPTFEDVKKFYLSLKPTAVPGRDFLFSIASNYPEKPEEEDMSRHRQFMEKLCEVYPFENLRKVFKTYMEKSTPIPLQNRRVYMKWMYGLLKLLSREAKSQLPTYRGYVARVQYYTSGCDKKTYRGITCRTMKNGVRTKSRDNRKTQRVSHLPLLR